MNHRYAPVDFRLLMDGFAASRGFRKLSNNNEVIILRPECSYMRKVQTNFSVGYGVLDVHWNRVTLYTYDPELLLDNRRGSLGACDL